VFVSGKKMKREGGDALSLAVLAFAVEDMKARESVITSARPCAFLFIKVV